MECFLFYFGGGVSDTADDLVTGALAEIKADTIQSV